MAKMVDPKTYASNVLKSARYITTKTIKELDPDIKNYIEDNGSYLKEMYESVKDYKGFIRNTVNKVLGETGYDDLKKVKGNILEDLRTGKFYNEEREESNNEELMNSMLGGGFDFDFDFDDEDSGSSNDERAKDEESPSTHTSVTESIAGILGNVTKSQRSTSVASTKSLLKGSRANTAALMAHTEKLFGSLNNSMTVINSSVLKLHQDIALPLNTHIINSTNFFNVMTNEVSQIHGELKNISSMIAERFEPKKEKKSKIGETWEDVIGTGLPNLRAWGAHAKKKLLSDFGLDMLFGWDTEMMSQILKSEGAASPIAFLISAALKKKIKDSALGKGIERTKYTLQGGFQHMMLAINRYAKEHRNDSMNPLAFLANLFSINPPSKSKLDFSKYNHDRQDWTGEDSKALKEVIPTQLGQILSAITGKATKIFDYKSGKWKTAEQITQKFYESQDEAIGSGSRDFLDKLVSDFIEEDYEQNKGKNIPKLATNSRAVINFTDTYNTLISLLVSSGKNLSDFKTPGELISYCNSRRWVSTSTNPSRDFFFDAKSLRRLTRLLYKAGGVKGHIEGAIVSGQFANARFMQSASTSTYAMLQNGSGLADVGSENSIALSNVLTKKDKYGRDVYWYLNSYYNQLNAITHGGLGGARSGSTGIIPSTQGSREFDPRNIRLTSVMGYDRAGRIKFRRGGVTSPDASDDDGDDAVSSYDRMVYNTQTEEYEEDERFQIRRPTSSNDREEEEKGKKKFIDRFFDKLNSILDSLFYGDDEHSLKNYMLDHGGLFGVLRDMPAAISDGVSDLKEKIANWASGKWNKFKESDYGRAYFRSMKNSVKSFFSGTSKQAKGYAGSVVDFMSGKPMSDRTPKPDDDTKSDANATVPEAKPEGSFRGGMVGKTGVIAASEGELIIPAKYNPLYRGHMSDGARKSAERRSYNNWLAAGGSDYFGSYAEGGTVSKKKLSPEEKDKVRRRYNSGFSVDSIAEELNRDPEQIQKFIDSVKESSKGALKKKAARAIKRTLNKAQDWVSPRLETIFGSEKLKTTKEYSQEAIKVVKNSIGGTLASATIGGLAGAALTGSGLGLLGGMVVGAGTHIIRNSDKISNKLFGTLGKDGNYHGGVLSDKTTKFIKNRLPKVGKSGAIGGVIGAALTGSGAGLLGGLALGAGLELVSTTDKFKDIMFGKPDVHGNRNGGIMGSIRDHVVNPLINFVKNGMKNIGSYIKENMLSPLGKLFNPIKDWIKGKTKSIMNSIVDSVKEKVTRTIGERFNAIFKPLTTAAKWMGQRALGLIKVPFKALGGIGESLNRHNIRMGYSSASIQDRMGLEDSRYGLAHNIVSLFDKEAAKNVGWKFKNSAYTKWAANASDQDIIDASRYMNGDTEIKKAIMDRRQNLKDTITASMRNGGNMDPALVKKITKAFNSYDVINDNNFKGVSELVAKLDDNVMDSTTKEKVADLIKEQSGLIKTDMDKRKTFATDKDAFFKRIGITNDYDLDDFIRHGRVQASTDAKGLLKKQLTDAASSVVPPVSEVLREQEQANPLDSERNKELSKQTGELSRQTGLIEGIAKVIGVKDSDLPKTSKGEQTVDSDDPNDSSAQYKTDANGNPIRYVTNDKGEQVIDMTDAQTKETVLNNKKEQEAKMKAYEALSSGGVAAQLADALGGSGDKGEKKESFFSKLKNLFTGGVSSLLGSVTSILKTALPTILAGVVLSKVGDGSASDGLDKATNIITGKDLSTYKEGDFISKSASSRYKSGILKNLVLSLNPAYAKSAGKVLKVTSKVPVIGKVFSGGLSAASKTGKLTSKVVESVGNLFGKNVAKTATNVAGEAAEQAVKKTATQITKKNGTKVFVKVAESKAAKSVASEAAEQVIKGSATSVSALAKIKSVISSILKTVATKFGITVDDKLFSQAAGEAAEQITKKGGTKLATTIAKATVVLNIALIANAVLSGLQKSKAKTILGILDDPTVGQRILAAAINGLNEAIPGVGGIIPSEYLVSVFVTLFNALGLPGLSKLTEQRKQAKATVEEYNSKNGTTYNVEEYIHNVLGEYTVQERIGKTLKNTGSKLVTKLKSIFKSNDDAEEKEASASGSSIMTAGEVNSTYSKMQQEVKNSTVSYAKSGHTSSNYYGDYYTGSGSSHVTQKGNMRIFGKSNLDQNGCGPASAATVLQSYGKNVGINDAATYAEAGGYVAGASGVSSSSGTKASYFGDILGRNGIKTSYTDSNSKIRSAVASGSPTILLGQDSNNHSKTRSPFGPNPHYIVAQGMDKNGNVLVDDPELNRPALYKNSILNKTKLGVITGGDSGTTESTSSSSGVTGVSGLISKAMSGISTAVSDKLGNSAAGKVWNLIFGIDKDYSTSSSDSSVDSDESVTSASVANAGVVTYGSNNLFKIATSIPKANDPNIKCFNNASNGGVSTCINGRPTNKVCNVLANCVGWAAGRYNQIYNLLMNTPNKMKYPFNCNAYQFMEMAASFGISTGNTPQVGAIMVWGKAGVFTNGHVAIVEKVISEDEVYTSESNYNGSEFVNKTRKKDNNGKGRWGNGTCPFLGFIYNPAVTYRTTSTSSKTSTISTTESKNKIWKYLKSKSLNNKAASGIMGCWENESGNRADVVEGETNSARAQNILKNSGSLANYTINTLFPKYMSNGTRISTSGYAGDDGKYYAGVGLAQWTGPRAQSFMAHADEVGKKYTDLDTQLDYFWKEFQEKEGLKQQLNSSENAADAATKFLDGFEMYKDYSTSHPETDNKRRNSAEAIYNTYSTQTGKHMTPTAIQAAEKYGRGSGLVGYDFTNPNNQFGSGSNAPVIRNNRATMMTGSASGINNLESLSTMVKYLETIAKNTSYNIQLETLVAIVKEQLEATIAFNNAYSSGSSGTSSTSQDIAKANNDQLQLMIAKLDSIAQTQ